MTAVLIIALCFGDAGNGTWLAYAFGTVMLLFVVGCLNQFAKRSALAGSMYGYTGRGLGPDVGRDLGVEPHLGLPLHRRRRPDRLLDLRRAVPVRHRGAHRRAPGDLLLA